MTMLPNSQVLPAALIAAMLFTAPAFAAQDRCPAKVLAALDKLGIKRASADNAPEMQYFVPHDFGAGSLNLHCVGKIPEVVIGVNSATPSEPFMNFFGAVAHDVAGVDVKDAIASAVLCRRSAVQAKGKKSGLFEGSRIDKPELHVDCRVGDNFTSLGVHRPLP